MGYTRSALSLEWPEDSEFSGLVVRMKRVSLKQVLRIDALADLRKAGTAEEIEAAWSEILDTVGKGLLAWNLDEEVVVEIEGAMVRTERVAVPATREALDDRDADLILAIVRAWTRAAAGVPLASPPTSDVGGQPSMPEPPAEEEWAAFLGQEQQALPSPVNLSVPALS